MGSQSAQCTAVLAKYQRQNAECRNRLYAAAEAEAAANRSALTGSLVWLLAGVVIGVVVAVVVMRGL